MNSANLIIAVVGMGSCAVAGIQSVEERAEHTPLWGTSSFTVIKTNIITGLTTVIQSFPFTLAVILLSQTTHSSSHSPPSSSVSTLILPCISIVPINRDPCTLWVGLEYFEYINESLHTLDSVTGALEEDTYNTSRRNSHTLCRFLISLLFNVSIRGPSGINSCFGQPENLNYKED